MNIYNFENVILEQIRVTEHSATLIDPILKSNHIDAVESGVLEVDPIISDHRATFISISCKFNTKCAYKRKIWLYKLKMLILICLNQLITEYNWNETIINAPSVHQATEIYLYIQLISETLCTTENNYYKT